MIKEKLKRFSALIFAAASAVFFITGFMLAKHEFMKAMRIGKAVGEYITDNAGEQTADILGKGNGADSGIAGITPENQAEQYNKQRFEKEKVSHVEKKEVSDDVYLKINWFIVSAAGILFIMSIIMFCRFINQIYIYIRNMYIRYQMEHPYIR